MKVKIVKSSYNKYWYSNKIGEKFEVFKGQWYPDSYTLLNKQIFHINVKDCIIIEEEEMKKNCIIIDGKEIKLSDETVKEIK